MPKTTTPLPQLVPGRINRAMADLKKALWTGDVSLAVAGGPVNDDFQPLAKARKQKFSPVRPGDCFGPPNGGWKQRWFRFDLPAAKKDERGRRAVFWVCPGEATFYVNGEPRGGCDAGHHYWLAPDEACEVWVDVGTYNSAIWAAPAAMADQHGLRFSGAFLKLRNQTAWNAYYDLEALFKLQDALRLEIRHEAPWMGYIAAREVRASPAQAAPRPGRRARCL